MRVLSQPLLHIYGALWMRIVGAMLVAVQMRLRIIAGKTLGSEYTAQPPALFVIITLSLAVALVSIWLFRRNGRWSQFAQFTTLMLAVIFTNMLTIIVLPDVSLLQLVYFSGFAALIGLITLIWTPVLNVRGSRATLAAHLQSLWENRVLLRMWVVYNVRSRYSQTLLGIAWIMLLPLATSSILAFVFSRIIRVIDIGDTPYVTFFLSAMVVWHGFSQGVLNGTSSLLREMNLITQVYFPREIIVIVRLGEAIIDFAFTFTAMLIINAVIGVWPNANYVYLPLLFVIQCGFTLGLMFFLSTITVMVRDIPQLVSVGLQLLFYLSPILYAVNSIPQELRFLVLINPLALLIDAYRSIIAYNLAPDPVNLYYPVVIAGVLLYTGYIFFKANERRIADFV
jgi:ABC-type polysaccharide/polyol phosphate export permease